MASPYPNYRSQFGDTTYTKVFVGGLAWETETEEMRRYFEQFGEILEAVIIKDKTTGKSKGYGFVTFRDPESARRACENPNPVIDGRRANCNIAALGRPRPSPPRGRMQGGRPYPLGGAPSYSGVPRPMHPPPPPMVYPPYGYTNYSPDYGYHQAIYNQQMQQPQYYQQMSRSSSSSMPTPYYYGYSLPAPRGAFPQGHRVGVAGPSYVYYPSQMEAYPDPANLSQSIPTRPQPPPSTDSQTPRSTSTEARVAASESPST